MNTDTWSVYRKKALCSHSLSQNCLIECHMAPNLFAVIGVNSNDLHSAGILGRWSHTLLYTHMFWEYSLLHKVSNVNKVAPVIKILWPQHWRT